MPIKVSCELETARLYRAHAGELRAIAESADDAKYKEQILVIAADYTHMADQLEQIDKTNKDIRKLR